MKSTNHWSFFQLQGQSGIRCFFSRYSETVAFRISQLQRKLPPSEINVLRQFCSEILRAGSIGGARKACFSPMLASPPEIPWRADESLLAQDVVQRMSTIAAPDVKYVIDHLQFVPNPGRLPGKAA